MRGLWKINELLIETVKNNPCVYFLVLNNKIQYIGQTVCLISRARDHLNNGKKFNHIFYINVPENELDNLEELLIKQYDPPLNGQYHSTRKKSRRNGEYCGPGIEMIKREIDHKIKQIGLLFHPINN